MEWSVRNVILEWAFVPPVLVLARPTLRVRARDCRHRLSTVDLFDRDLWNARGILAAIQGVDGDKHAGDIDVVRP
jgi:hypothetical protein